MDEIINYVMTNPENTNPNILRSMLENYGGGGGLFVVNVIPDETDESGETYIADKTAKECYDAFMAGMNVYCYYDMSYFPINDVAFNDDSYTYYVYFSNVNVSSIGVN